MSGLYLLLVGFSGSFAPCPLPALAGRHDKTDFISLTQPAVNNPNPAIESKRVVLGEEGVVSENLQILLVNPPVPKLVCSTCLLGRQKS
jgi:hypothetical protein